MLIKLVAPCKRFVAILATKWFFTSTSSHMSVKLIFAPKNFTALLTAQQCSLIDSRHILFKCGITFPIITTVSFPEKNKHFRGTVLKASDVLGVSTLIGSFS
jgi:hypothetical protein